MELRDEAIQTFDPEAREASLLIITRGDVADDAESCTRAGGSAQS